MTDIICPLCGKPNPPELNECQYCQAPLKTGGFIAPEEDKDQTAPIPSFSGGLVEESGQAAAPDQSPDLEGAIPDWLKETEAGSLEPSEAAAEEPASKQLSEQIDSLVNPPPGSQEPQQNGIDDKWLASLLTEAGLGEGDQPAGKSPGDSEKGTAPPSPESMAEIEEELSLPIPPEEKPEWLADLESSSKLKFEGGIFPSEPEQPPPAPVKAPEEKGEEQAKPPEWLTRPTPPEPVESQKIEDQKKESQKKEDASLAPAEMPGWLEVLRPAEGAAPTGPVEDVSGAEIVTAGPLTGLRGVISALPSAVRVQKPPTYSIKLKVTEEQQARLQMMEELLASEEKPKPLPSQPVITSRYIFRLIVAVLLLLPMIWMIIAGSHQSQPPQPGNVPGVVDFTQQVQALPADAPVLVAFDYEAGFSGELNMAVTNMVSQLINKNIYLTLVSTSSFGPALAENIISDASSAQSGNPNGYPNYADLGFIPGGTMGLQGLAASPKSILPYNLDGIDVWDRAPLNTISTVKDFAAVIVITSDPDVARFWIEQVGTQLHDAGTPLLIISSSQAEPLIRPYYEAAQVQGLLAGLTGGVAYARTVGNYQPNGIWDAYSAGITISVLIILIGSIAGMVIKMLAGGKTKETDKQP